MVEPFAMTGDMLEDGLISQLYATIPLGSVTADHETVRGTVTLAPFGGPSKVGAGGPVWAKAARGRARKKTSKAAAPAARMCFIPYLHTLIETMSWCCVRH